MEANQIAPLDENRIPLKDKRVLRCAIYTRKSSDEGLEQEFNSLDAQRESCEAYILSQKREGWLQIPDHYDDGGYSGGNMERPGLKEATCRYRERLDRCGGGLQDRSSFAFHPGLH